MIAPGQGAALFAGALLLLIVVSGAAALFVGLRARNEAAATRKEGARLTALLTTAPLQAMIVRADGRIEVPQRLADWLGFTEPPRFLNDLAGAGIGLDAAVMTALGDDAMAAGKAGRSFTRQLSAGGSSRALAVHGMPAPRDVGAPGGAVLWFFDATESSTELARIEGERAAAEAAFAELTSLIEAAPMPMWYRGPDLRLTMVNSAYADAVEAAGNRDVVERGVELVEGSGPGGPLANAVAARDGRRVQIQPMPSTIRGERRMLRVYDVPMPDGGVAGFAMDIEDLEQARAWIRQFGDAQRALLDRLSAGVAQFAADRSLAFCNQPFRRLFGLRREWLAEAPEFDRVLERMREANRLPEVRDFPGWRAERREWFVATGGAIEEPWHLPGGIHLRVVAQSLPDGGLLLIFEDRTEQVQLASARDTLLRVRTATFDNLAEALGVFAADGRLQLWNNKFRRLWAFDEELLATHPRIDALVEAGAARLANPAQAGLINRLVHAATVERQHRVGRVAFADGRYYEFAAVPLPDGNGLFTMHDITDGRRIERALRERNQALEAADRIKTAFVANMSYELRTPLTSISGFAEMLEQGYAGKLSEAAQGYVAAILQSTHTLATLVDEVLDLTQRSDAAELERREFDLAALVEAAGAAAEPLARDRALDFAVSVLPSSGRVTGDAARVQQMMDAVLGRVLRGTPEGRRVLLHADGDGREARIVVSDDGPGEADPETAAELADARRIAEAHGGGLGLVSEPGQGSLVTITLPRR